MVICRGLVFFDVCLWTCLCSRNGTTEYGLTDGFCIDESTINKIKCGVVKKIRDRLSFVIDL